MTNEEVVNELKEKKLPTFGTGVERKERLKKHYGKNLHNNLCLLGLIVTTTGTAVNDSTLKDGTNNILTSIPISTT